MQENIVYINGEFYPKSQAKVSVFDHGFLYGDGIFEGIRAYNGKIFRFDEHIDRLFKGAKAIYLDIPLTKDEIKEIILKTVRANNLRDAYIRPVISRGMGDLGLDPTKCPNPSVVVIVDELKLYPQEMYEKGMKVITSSVRRNSPSSIDPQIKSLNYLNNILAKIEAVRYQVPEAIMLNHEGIVTECTGDNIFIIQDGKLYTPPIHIGALDGITRKVVFQICKKFGLQVYEKEFALFNLYNADECFLTGTGAEVIAVTEVDGRQIGFGVEGALTKKILHEFKNITQSEGTDIYS